MDVTEVAACIGYFDVIFARLVPVYALPCQVVWSLRQLFEIVLAPHTGNALEVTRTAPISTISF